MDTGAMVELKAVLAVLAGTGRPRAEIAAALDRVEALARALGPGTPAELRHFLERRSYVKALAFLERKDA